MTRTAHGPPDVPRRGRQPISLPRSVKGLVAAGIGYRLALTDAYIDVGDLTAAQGVMDRLESQDGQPQLVVSYPGGDRTQIELRPGEATPG